MNTPHPANPAAPTRRALLLAGAALAALTLAAYHGSFTGPFLYDDVSAIPGNPTIRHLGALRAIFSPPPETTVHNRPVLNLSFALNHAISGDATWSYHVLNLIVHLLAGLVLFGLVRRTLLQPKLRPRFAGVALPVAFFSALLWLLHPVQTQCVAYIVERAESMMGLFYLLTLYGFVRGAETGAVRWPWHATAILSCLLSMGTKEVAATAPVMVLLYDRTFVSGSFREAWRRHRWIYAGLAATWLTFAPLAAAGGRRDSGSGFGIGVPFWPYVRTQFPAVVHYLRVSFWPHPLRFYYGWGSWLNYVKVHPLGSLVPSVLLLAPLLAGTAYALWRWRPIGFAGAWFFGILAPTSLVPGLGDTVADRRLYLSLAAIIVPLVLGVYARWGKRSIPVFMLIAVALGGVTERRIRVYGSELAFWRDLAASGPDDPLPPERLGTVLRQLGRADEARAEFGRALVLERAVESVEPQSPAAHFHLGETLARLGRTAEAEAELERALALAPDYFSALDELARLRRTQGRFRAAALEFTELVRLKPDVPDYRENLGVALGQTGRLPEAIAQFQAALRLDPDFAVAHNDLGIAYGIVGRLPESIAEFETALRLQPDLIQAYYDLSVSLRKAGRNREADLAIATARQRQAAALGKSP